MNELRIVDVNTYVRELAAARIEKNQIAGREFFSGDTSSQARHVHGHPGQLDIERMAKNKLYETTAIKTCLR